MNRLVASLMLTGLSVCGFVSYANAATEGFTSGQKQEIQSVVREYLIKNPDVVVQSLQAFQQQQMEQAKKTMEKTQANSPKFADNLFHQANDPAIGNAAGKVTVVEFFDYQCPHCIDMVPVIDAVVATNKDVRVVFKEFPIRGPVSEFAARAALAAKQQGKYYELHKALMGVKQQPLTQDAILAIAKNIGLDVDKLKVAMNSKEVNQEIKDTYQLAQQLQLLGTPAFFIAKSDVNKNSNADAVVFLPGQVSKEQMQAAIQKISK